MTHPEKNLITYFCQITQTQVPLLNLIKQQKQHFLLVYIAYDVLHHPWSYMGLVLRGQSLVSATAFKQHDKWL